MCVMETTDIQKCKILDSEYLIRRPWLTARKDKLELPDGRIIDEYYILEYPVWVNIIAIDENGDFVMVEQYRHGLGEVFTELCAGVVEEGELPEEAARRELLEETGYSGGKWTLLNKICQNPSTCTNYTYCFLAEGVKRTDTQHLDKTEDVAIKILPCAELLQMLQNDEIKQSLMAAPLWHYFATTPPLNPPRKIKSARK